MTQDIVQRLTTFHFDLPRFLKLATHGGENFPDKEGRKWVADHFDVTLQVFFKLFLLKCIFLGLNRLHDRCFWTQIPNEE